MYQYLVRRLLGAVPLLLIISVMLFTILQLQPIHAWDQLLYRPNITAADKARILAYYGFDKPAPIQYLLWMRNLLHLDLGTSYFSHQPTLELIGQRLPNTGILMITAYSLALVLAIPIGVISAVKQYSKFDNFVTTAAFFGFSIPNFWLGLMLIIIFAVIPYEHLGFKIFPTSGMYDTDQAGDPFNLAWHLVLPAVVLAVQFIAQYSRFIRSAMLDVLNHDFVRTARAKGLSEKRIVVRHAFRNALLPLISLMGIDIPRLFVGALITEQVFAWPGMGRLFWKAANDGDVQVLMGVLILLAVLVVLGNLLADLAYGWADPRVQFKGAR